MTELFKIYEDRYAKFCDKGTRHSYINFYEGLFLPFRTKELNLLEVGVQRGASLNLWAEYFTNAKNIVGVDINNSALEEQKKQWNDRGNTFFIQSSSADKKLLDNSVVKDNKFDIIIDDGAHDHKTQLKTFDNLYDKVNSGGIYIVEDVLRTSAWRFLKYYESLKPYHLNFVEHKHFYPSRRRRTNDNQLIIFIKK
tara:strand:- start:61 stop:648 length:588 start_codon:yes stop_codon:yes gene_type:complete